MKVVKEIPPSKRRIRRLLTLSVSSPLHDYAIALEAKSSLETGDVNLDKGVRSVKIVEVS
jgi:hypothetical protein